MELSPWIAAGTVHTFQGNQANIVIFDSVLDEPYWSARLCNPNDSEAALRDINVAVTRARDYIIFVGSSDWLNKHAKVGSALGKLWGFLKEKADLISSSELLGETLLRHKAEADRKTVGWNPKTENEFFMEILDDENFFERFSIDVDSAGKAIFALAPYFGEYRWPRVQPLFSAALARGVEITIIIPPLEEAQNKSYVSAVVKNLKSLSAVVVEASGIHGKDVIIDESIIYTGSMNWSSHRGRSEVIHRIYAPKYAKQCL